MAQLARETGYMRAVITKIAATLGICFRRIDRGDRPYKTKNHRSIAVSYEQEQRIVKYLKDNRHFQWHYPPGSKRSNVGVWGTGQKPSACARCERKSRPHYAKGMCHPCYNSVNRSAWRAARRAALEGARPRR